VTVQAACDACRHYRHKQLGHSDLAMALKVEPIPIITIREVDEALDAIERFLGTVYTEIRPDESPSFRFLNGSDHVDRLFRRLTNRASRLRPNAVSHIVKTAEGARLFCAFCGESAQVWMFADDVPEGRYLRLWHFRNCTGLVGTEDAAVEMTDENGAVRSRVFRLSDE